MHLRIPPAVVFFVSIGFVYIIHYLLPSLSLKFQFQTEVSVIFLVAGFLIGIAALLSFRENQTTVDPTSPEKASSLVTSGIYAYSRNPMYLAMALGVFASIIYFGNSLGIFALLFYIWYLTVFQIIPEEQSMLKLFGTEYRRYCEKVRRWL